MLTESQLEKMRKIFSDYPAVIKTWVFGSYARNEEAPESDIDILVELDYSQRIGMKFYGLWADLEEATGKSVDLIPEDCLKDFARESANRDKILIYDREQYVKQDD